MWRNSRPESCGLLLSVKFITRLLRRVCNTKAFTFKIPTAGLKKCGEAGPAWLLNRTGDISLFLICSWTFKKSSFIQSSFFQTHIDSWGEKIACYRSITWRKICKARRLHSANSSSNSGRYRHPISHTPILIENVRRWRIQCRHLFWLQRSCSLSLVKFFFTFGNQNSLLQKLENLCDFPSKKILNAPSIAFFSPFEWLWRCTSFFAGCSWQWNRFSLSGERWWRAKK